MRRSALAAGLIMVLAVASACSGSGGSGRSGASAGGAVDSGSGRVVPIGAPEARPANVDGAKPGKGADGSSTPGTTASTQLVPLGTSLIKTAQLQVEIAKAADVAGRADAAGQIAVANGGSVFADTRTTGEHATAELTLKVPPDELAAVLTKLSALGREVSRQSSTEDVTSQVADVDSRVRSAQDSLIRLRALYDHASKIGDIIEIESEIAQREADLESLEAQQRTLAAQTSMATLQLYLTAAAATAAAKHHDKGGFLGGLSNGWHAFTSAAGAIATGVGAVLPFLLLALLIGAAGWRLRPRRTQPPPAPLAE